VRQGDWPAVLILFLVIASLPATATETWARTIGGSEYGALFGIILYDDGHVLAVGATNHVHSPTREGDVLLMKLTVDGETLWERTWGGTEFEQAWAVAPSQAGGFYVFGETASFGAGERDFFLLRIDPNGNEEWVRTYGSSPLVNPYMVNAIGASDLASESRIVLDDSGLHILDIVIGGLMLTKAGDYVSRVLTGCLDPLLLVNDRICPHI